MHKQEKLNNLIKRELSQIILRELDLPSDIVVTVTRVAVASSGFYAKVFVSIIPTEKREGVIDALERRIYFLQQQLNKKLKIRPVPKIEFVTEKKTEEAGRVEELLKKIKDLEKNE
ncbi:MAG: 30S ribosome-binding factor RbfA [Candidatus Pacebacteria bacterium]|nr:30S ribosome-binding factor RbfA [Candidatus Paceibacterota bacterium]